MLRNDHEIMIEQNDKYATIRLRDKHDSGDGKLVYGSWEHSSKSYNDQMIMFTSANQQYCYWEWNGPHSGGISIGVKMQRASHKAGENSLFQILMVLLFAHRGPSGKFEVGSGQSNGAGNLTYNVSPHFFAGPILWTPVRYERQ